MNYNELQFKYIEYKDAATKPNTLSHFQPVLYMSFFSLHVKINYFLRKIYSDFLNNFMFCFFTCNKGSDVHSFLNSVNEYAAYKMSLILLETQPHMTIYSDTADLIMGYGVWATHVLRICFKIVTILLLVIKGFFPFEFLHQRYGVSYSVISPYFRETRILNRAPTIAGVQYILDPEHTVSAIEIYNFREAILSTMSDIIDHLDHLKRKINTQPNLQSYAKEQYAKNEMEPNAEKRTLTIDLALRVYDKTLLGSVAMFRKSPAFNESVYQKRDTSFVMRSLQQAGMNYSDEAEADACVASADT